MKTRNKKSGFTLVELMIVAAIIAILAAILIPLMTQNKIAAVAAEGQNICGALMSGAKTQYARKSQWPATVAALDDGDLKNDALNTKYWTVTGATSLGTKSNATITINVDATKTDYAGSITLQNDSDWLGTGDFTSISD